MGDIGVNEEKAVNDILRPHGVRKEFEVMFEK